MRFNFFTFLVYSPRGKSENAIRSKKLLGACKNGGQRFSQSLAEKILEFKEDEYFQDSILVPVPRSSPLVDGALLPSKIIADALVNNGLGTEVLNCLKRTKAIPKSSSQYSAESRNSVDTHLESMEVEIQLIPQETIILIDDVLTLGRTAMASAIKIQNAFPGKTIKIFCPFRTRSFSDDNILLDIKKGSMFLSANRKVVLPD